MTAHTGTAATEGAPGEDLERLAHDARSGDPVAMHRLLQRIHLGSELRTAIRKLIIDRNAVHDVAQEVLLAVSRDLHRRNTQGPFVAWLRGVARNKSVDYVRAQRPTEPLSEQTTTGGGGRISSIITNREVINAAIRSLPAKYRAPVQMRDIDQLTYEEIAATLGLTIVATRARVARGRNKVAAKMNNVPL